MNSMEFLTVRKQRGLVTFSDVTRSNQSFSWRSFRNKIYIYLVA